VCVSHKTTRMNVGEPDTIRGGVKRAWDRYNEGVNIKTMGSKGGSKQEDQWMNESGTWLLERIPCPLKSTHGFATPPTRNRAQSAQTPSSALSGAPPQTGVTKPLTAARLQQCTTTQPTPTPSSIESSLHNQARAVSAAAGAGR
jgi:hypothetical protein